MKVVSVLIALIAAFCLNVQGQVDTTSTEDDEFDFSEFELAAPPAKSFCTNKVLGQTPTVLIGITYDIQLPQDFTAGNLVAQPEANISDQTEIAPGQNFGFQANFPVISRNNLLINVQALYNEQHYNIDNSNGHPLSRSLDQGALRRSGAYLTVFKPLNDRHFLLGQVGAEVNGTYGFDNFSESSNVLIPAAVFFGFKPSDRLMYALGLSRTYLGGALNYVPIFYYYHTFRNEKWGIEAIVPSRGLLRYRFNSTSLLGVGFNTQGASYRLGDFNTYAREFAVLNPDVSEELLAAEDVELRRSEIRVGLNYQKKIGGFFWLNAEAGYRIEYSFELDEGGDFLRFWGNNEPYFIENELGNTPYFSIGISYVSP